VSESWFQAPAPLLPEILALNARWLGSKPALVCGAQQRSWQAFHAGLCRVANGLHSQGIAHGDRVAVLMNNSLDMVDVLFGVLHAGAVVVPINTLVSDRALAPMINDSGARAVIACRAQAPRLQQARHACTAVPAENWLCMDDDEAGWQARSAWLDPQAATAALPALADEDPCNIIYSSGTTGQPKGIVHSHRRRLDWCYDLAIALRYDRASINLCAIGLFSNISWAGMGCTLVAGGTLVVMPAFDAGAWLAAVAEHQVTHSAMVPVMFQRILEHPDFATASLGSIKSLMCCGAPLDARLKQAIMQKLAPQLVELYGLTEGLITTLDPEDAADRPASVGKPLMGTDLRILNEQDQACAPGVAGEIVGRGRILMAGYHGRPDANTEATWTCPDGHRWLRTGDIGYLDEAGFLFLVDRKKDLIISGGQNIYPADIEAIALEHPAVSEVAVVGIYSSKWGETPLAVVVQTSGAQAAADELRDWINARSGKHQRVAGVQVRAELPRNANGKILKRELREQYQYWLEQAPGEPA
jgi:acyl-CoA synthetase (AMP-forming)/AMP-acid ligase II